MKFPRISEGKLRAGVFDGSQIRELTKVKGFTACMSAVEKKSMNSFSGKQFQTFLESIEALIVKINTWIRTWNTFLKIVGITAKNR